MWDSALDPLIAQRLPNGDPVKELNKTLSLRLSNDQRYQLLKEGFTISRTIAVRPDASIHIVIRDAAGGVAGSVATIDTTSPR